MRGLQRYSQQGPIQDFGNRGGGGAVPGNY